MLSIELINLYSNILAPANYFAISPVIPRATSPASGESILFAPAAFIKDQNLVLGILGLATDSNVTTNSGLTIWIYDQLFMS